jgi:hypothetical protein
MADDAEWAADMAERERQALIQRHLRRQPPPAKDRRGAIYDQPTPRRKPLETEDAP